MLGVASKRQKTAGDSGMDADKFAAEAENLLVEAEAASAEVLSAQIMAQYKDRLWNLAVLHKQNMNDEVSLLECRLRTAAITWQVELCYSTFSGFVSPTGTSHIYMIYIHTFR